MGDTNMDCNTILTSTPQNTPIMVKTIGRTTYEVSIHFSTTGSETMSDKIKRLIKHDMSN